MIYNTPQEVCLWFTVLLPKPQLITSLPQGQLYDCPGAIGQNKFTNPTMHLFHIPQCIIQNISVLNGPLSDMEQMHCGICEIVYWSNPDNYDQIDFMFLEFRDNDQKWVLGRKFVYVVMGHLYRILFPNTKLNNLGVSCALTQTLLSL